MRYYKIDIIDPENPDKVQTYTSWVNGKNDFGALNVIFDLYVVPFATPYSVFAIQIWGISLQSISQASNLNGKNIKIYGGMKQGLPLANSSQSGLLVQGFVLQAFGNWIGNDMTLDLIVSPGDASPSSYPATFNGSFQWVANSNLSDTLKSFFNISMPDYNVKININDKLVVPTDIPGVYKTLDQFASWLKDYTKSLIGGNYGGVNIFILGKDILVYDNTVELKTTSIKFQELIGQPTWIEPLKIQFTCPMRSDIQIGDRIEMPKNTYYNISTSASTGPWDFRNKSAQQGKFTVIEVHHYGNFRQPDAKSWVTVITCAYIQSEG